MASLSFHWCCILRHFCLGMCLHARESDLCHWAFQIYYFFAFSPFLIHLWCQWLTWSDLTWSDAEIINAGQIFAHTFLALFLYELLLAENSYQTPWLPKRKNRSQLKEQLLKKKKTNKQEEAGLSTFDLTTSLAQAISDDLHFMVRIFPSPSCKTVALFLNQPLSVKINCKGHKSIESQLHIVKIQLISLCPVNITRWSW